MCGHDGHITCLIAALSLILENRNKYPNNCTLRAIFQPGEEGYGGATLMINEGVMEGVDEVYGLHNVPYDNPGDVYVKPGYMMAAIDKITITAEGKGGHSSLIHELINPVHAISLMNTKIDEAIRSEYSEEYPKNLRISFPQIVSASACNIIPDKAQLIGTSRMFDEKLRYQIRETLSTIAKEVELLTKTKISIDYFPVAKTPVKNDEILTNNFIKLLNGEIKNDKIPIFASEDFADYQEKVPGVFFFLAGGTKCGDSLHVDNYNFNDDIIEKAAEIFLKITIDRLNQ